MADTTQYNQCGSSVGISAKAHSALCVGSCEAGITASITYSHRGWHIYLLCVLWFWIRNWSLIEFYILAQNFPHGGCHQVTDTASRAAWRAESAILRLRTCTRCKTLFYYEIIIDSWVAAKSHGRLKRNMQLKPLSIPWESPRTNISHSSSTISEAGIWHHSNRQGII